MHLILLALFVIALAILVTTVRRRRTTFLCEVCRKRRDLDHWVFLPEGPTGLVLCSDCETGR